MVNGQSLEGTNPHHVLITTDASDVLKYILMHFSLEKSVIFASYLVRKSCLRIFISYNKLSKQPGLATII